MGSAFSPEPTPGFTGDRAGHWDIRIDALRSYLGSHDLVFIFDNAQEGNAANQWLQIWGQAEIRSANGLAQIACFELNNSLAPGCTHLSPQPTPSIPALMAILEAPMLTTRS